MPGEQRVSKDSGSAMLEVTDVQLRVDAGGGFSHRFAPGEITVVLGANRSGKTKLCRLVAGLNSDATGGVNLHFPNQTFGTRTDTGYGLTGIYVRPLIPLVTLTGSVGFSHFNGEGDLPAVPSAAS